MKQTKDQIKFTVGKGKAKAAVESLRKQFRDAGWKENVASIERMAGTLSFSKGDGQSVNITYYRHWFHAVGGQSFGDARRTGSGEIKALPRDSLKQETQQYK